MKYMLIALIAISSTFLFSQEIQITVSANNNSITASPDDNNNDKLLIINNSLPGNNFLTINIVNEETDKDWKRNFFISDSTGNAIKDFMLMKDGSYCIKINELTKLLKPQKDYFIYTIAIPKDPQKAMLIKPAKKLVCKIKIL